MRKVNVRFLFEPRDLWVGVYWTTDPWPKGPIVRVYLCLVPMLVIRFSWWRINPDGQ